MLGDIAFRYLKYLNNLSHNGDDTHRSHVTISDINQNMLDVGKIRAKKLGFIDGSESMNTSTVDWVCANAEQLPFADNSFTAYTIAFGIRNCTHIDKVELVEYFIPLSVLINYEITPIRCYQKRSEFSHRVDDLCVWNLVI